ncbi:hypothetical protein C6341_g23286 [Phytophthora cactorum]|nr:hypothetical protein C6341_g23286 [Phytophthora cactorum]
MHTNDGSLAENWIIEQGGWQLDRVNKAFGYKLGTTQADQHVSRVLSGWHPKEGARLPSLRALEYPVVACAEKIQVLLFTNTLGCDDHTMNLEEDVAEVLTATLILHYPDMLVLSPDSAIVARIRDAMSARAIGEDEVLAWSDTIRRAFTSPPEISKPSDSDPHSAERQNCTHRWIQDHEAGRQMSYHRLQSNLKLRMNHSIAKNRAPNRVSEEEGLAVAFGSLVRVVYD